jgi:putative IMPACT (imprinted ancient) family translation regulator
LAERIELIAKKTIHFSCHFSEWAIFQYELTQQQIEYQETYTVTGVDIEARLQIHQIEPLALKLRDVTRGREELKIEEELTDD